MPTADQSATDIETPHCGLPTHRTGKPCVLPAGHAEPDLHHCGPDPGEFCHRHFSWLCQAGQGECQREGRDG